ALLLDQLDLPSAAQVVLGVYLVDRQLDAVGERLPGESDGTGLGGDETELDLVAGGSAAAGGGEQQRPGRDGADEAAASPARSGRQGTGSNVRRGNSRRGHGGTPPGVIRG